MRGLTPALVASTWFLVALALPRPAQGDGRSPARPHAGDPAPFCSGEYADDLSALAARARELTARQALFTYCIRSSAVYECPSYAPDGTLRKTRRRAVSHGTGFGYRREGDETLVVSNEHVSEWPEVSTEDDPVEGVPLGCRRVSSAVRIVDNESDAYERDDVALSRVVADRALDVSVLRAKAELPVVPWKMGRSDGLRERNAVDVQGFPLGVLRASNAGKVISTHDPHDQNGWDHDDFVIDALLSPGNSGSPVFAVSCRTGEPELVGVYHARYTKGNALNMVVGIDQVRELMTTLQRPQVRRPEAPALDAAARRAVAEAARGALEPFFPFGDVVAGARARDDGAVVFEVMGPEFPVQSHPILVLEDLPPTEANGGFGSLGRVWAGNRQGLRQLETAAMEPEASAVLSRALDALRRDALLAATYRSAARRAVTSREQFQEMKRLERSVRRRGESRKELAQTVVELSEQLCPKFSDAPGTLADALSVPSGPATAGVPEAPGAEAPDASGSTPPTPANAPPPDEPTAAPRG